MLLRMEGCVQQRVELPAYSPPFMRETFPRGECLVDCNYNNEFGRFIVVGLVLTRLCSLGIGSPYCSKWIRTVPLRVLRGV